MIDRVQIKATAVLVHAAWADGSSWNKVTTELQSKGIGVVAAQIPLTSFSDDVAALRRLLRRQDGPVILAGHSYGGAVATAAAAGDPDVKALVYVAAIVPDQGETVGEVFRRQPPHPNAPQLQPDADGFLWLDLQAFRDAVAPDASSEETAFMAANQKPIALKCLGEPMTRPGWKEKPSWFLVAEKDRMLSPETQRFTARRISAQVLSASVDHFPLISAPGLVSRLICEAVDATIQHQ
jgi:pimeloyl-ACP methyl ester carboxylesterase